MKSKTFSLTRLSGLALAASSHLAVCGESHETISVAPIGSVAAGSFLTSAAEIAAHDPATQRLYVVNAQAAQIDVIDIDDPSAPVLRDDLSLDVTPYGAVANSVDVHNGLIAVAVEALDKTQPGKVVFFDRTLKFIAAVDVGAMPDMLTFTPNGRFVLTANEGEPSGDYLVDPEGSISIIDLKRGAARATVRTAGFGSFNGRTRSELFNGTGAGAKPAIRVFGPNASVAQDFEPEFITTSADSKTAWVTLQENNALAVIDIESATVKAVQGLGVKDHSLPDNGFGSGNGLDASDRDGVPVANAGRINIQNWPVKGFYLPDGIASFKVRGQTYLVLANEGDSRDWPGYSEEARVGSLTLDSSVFPTSVAAELKKTANLGRLKATTAQGDTDGNKVFKEIYTFGARSFSIRSSSGALVWDSGDQFEQITAALEPTFFNSNHEINKFDDRSDDKGPEPEGVAVGKVGDRTYAFIGLERLGGLMVYDVTEPSAPAFVQFVNNRDFTQPPATPAAGDLGPEGVLFISGEHSPNRRPLLVVSNEVSGTTTIYEISRIESDDDDTCPRHDGGGDDHRK